MIVETKSLQGKTHSKRDKYLASARRLPADERLRAIVEIATAKIGMLRPEDVIYMDRKVASVCGYRFGFFAPTKEKEVARVRRALVRLQRDLLWILEAAFHEADAWRNVTQMPGALTNRAPHATFYQYGESPGAIRTILIEPDAPCRTLHVRLSLELTPSGVRLAGSVRDRFLLEVHRVVEEDGGNLLRVCPHCGAPFVRRRKQGYCSQSCYYKQWTQTPKGIAHTQKHYEKNGWTRGGAAARQAKRSAKKRSTRARVP